MIYVSAVYANAERTLVTGTDADGISETVPYEFKVLRCPDEGPKGFERSGGVIADYVAPAPGPYRIYKKTIWERVDSDAGEDLLLEAAIQAEAAQLRQIYHATEYFVSDDTLFAYLHWVIASALGSVEAPNNDRADALLAPEA